MTTRVFLGTNDTFVAASNNLNIFGATGGDEKLLVLPGVTGFVTNPDIERIELSGFLADYKFVVVAGTGFQVQNSDGTVVGTIPSLNQTSTFAFADGSATLSQTGGTVFSLGGQTISTAAATSLVTTLNTADKSSTAPTQTVIKNITVNVSGAGNYDASAANTAYNFSSGSYTVNIDKFSALDALQFPAGTSVSVINTNTNDGIMDIVGANNNSGTVVTVHLTGIAAGLTPDAAVFNTNSFSTVFGSNSLLVGGALIQPTSGPVSLNVNSAGSYDATAGNITFNVAAGKYTYTINHFTSGDVIKFLAGTSASIVPDANLSDGIKDISATDSASGSTTTIHLVGLTPAQDAEIFNMPSVNTVFGTGTIVFA